MAPFHYYASDDEVLLLNNKFQKCHSFNLFETYGDKIVKTVLGAPFENIIIISPAFLYILSYDLQVKARISLLNNGDKEGVAIYGTELDSDKSVFNEIGLKVRIYPFMRTKSVETSTKLYGKKEIRLKKGSSRDLGRLKGVNKISLSFSE